MGAVQLLPPGEEPQGWHRIEAEPLSDRDVDTILAAVTSDAPLGPTEDDDLRISIAGAQEKTALLRMGGKWHRPHGATPTTHILTVEGELPRGLPARVWETIGKGMRQQARRFETGLAGP